MGDRIARRPRGRLSLIGLALCLGLVAVPLLGRDAFDSEKDGPRGPHPITASGAVLLDARTGKVLWGRESNVPRPIASTSKLMTAAVVMRSGIDLDRRVTIRRAYTDRVYRAGGSTAHLRPGDRLSVRQLLYAMLLPSGSEAAYALADVVGRGPTSKDRVADFVRRMNRHARLWGLTGTRFGTPDGTGPGASNRATPRSLALLAGHALQDPTIASIVATLSVRQVVTTETGKRRAHLWRNSNRLLGNYAGVVGVKTGTSTPAGPCLVFAARREGRYVIGVVLNARDEVSRYRDAVRMLDWVWPVLRG